MYRSSSLVYWVMLCMSWYSCREKEISDDLDQQIEDVLSGLSLEEKVGQLNQLRGKPTTATNSKDAHFDLDEEIRKGRVGTFLNVHPLEDKMRLQKIAVEESSHGIPLIFAIDILHGFRTNFPVPLGEAASWDVEGIERSARIAAVEGSAVGFMWTMAPMVDISFDARWGRVMEGAGEDPYLGSLIAQARIRGFQGEDLAAPNTILACAKHFAGYGQVLAGRDYNQTWVSKRFLHDYVFPPFKAAADAGVASFMSAFTDFDGLPANISSYLLDDVLRKEWQYKGAVISDFNAIEELVEWRVAASRKEAAKLALTAGNDIDMMGLVFIDHLAELVREGRVPEQKIDDAVRRVLRLKFQLGLFDDPYRYFTPGLDEKVWLTDDHRRHAREIASSSMVLLKNDENILPLKASKYPKIAVIGTTDSNPMNLMGTWSAWGKTENVVSIVEGIKTKVGFGSQVVFARGCEDEDSENPALLSEALRVAKSSDLIILTLGEGWRNS
ncbi:MAG: glycoside hydrolase family 3 C-terminal domain-containing protein, partial [Cyclobacteriaceae bacterium]|nr:glycoside hydrolase family 3 C-terminal domain-containing protein [Cyclobacteriaceae bacterium HetDA_MAG_MS6]